MVATAPNFTYGTARLKDFQLELGEPKGGQPTIKHVVVKDEPAVPTNRFYSSLSATFGLGKIGPILKYVPADTLLKGMIKAHPDMVLRTVVERNQHGNNRLLALSKVSKAVARYDDVIETVGKYGGSDIKYVDGRVESFHSPRVGSNTFEVLGDAFENRFQLSVPIDGYGAPSVYLALLRQICSNGMVGRTRAFKTELAIGRGDDNVMFSINRALDSFNSDEGYAALRQRIEKAGKSWASVYESMQLYKRLIRGQSRKNITFDLGGTRPTGTIAELLTSKPDGKRKTLGEIADSGSPILTAFHRMTGDITELYGLANTDALSPKRQRTLPVRCSVYDVLNFATEVATHYATPSGANDLNAWVGGMMGAEYDMDGTKETFGEFADFHVGSKLSAGLTGSANDPAFNN